MFAAGESYGIPSQFPCACFRIVPGPWGTLVWLGQFRAHDRSVCRLPASECTHKDAHQYIAPKKSRLSKLGSTSASRDIGGQTKDDDLHDGGDLARRNQEQARIYR